MRTLMACVVVVGCRTSDPPPSTTPSTTTATAPRPSPPVSSIDDVVRELAAGRDPDRVCFAVSQDRRRVACAFASNGHHDCAEPDATVAEIQILGDIDHLESTWRYVDVMPPEPPIVLDRAALEAARIALTERHYVPWRADAVLTDGASVHAGRWTVRRRLIHPPGDDKPPYGWNDQISGPYVPSGIEQVELQCQARWLPIKLDVDLANLVANPDQMAMRVAALGDLDIVITGDGTWAAECESQATRTAQLIDARALCPSAPPPAHSATTSL